MRAGSCNKWVTLSRAPEANTEAPFTDLTPPGSWAAIEPSMAAGITDRTITHIVRLRFHPEITLDTRIQYVDARIDRTRDLFVRGVQHVSEAGDELQLLCEEVQP